MTVIHKIYNIQQQTPNLCELLHAVPQHSVQKICEGTEGK